MHNLGLNETTQFGDFQIMRVPGGWIYRFWNHKEEDYTNSVFVPYNTEFLPRGAFE